MSRAPPGRQVETVPAGQVRQLPAHQERLRRGRTRPRGSCCRICNKLPSTERDYQVAYLGRGSGKLRRCRSFYLTYPQSRGVADSRIAARPARAPAAGAPRWRYVRRSGRSRVSSFVPRCSTGTIAPDLHGSSGSVTRWSMSNAVALHFSGEAERARVLVRGDLTAGGPDESASTGA